MRLIINGTIIENAEEHPDHNKGSSEKTQKATLVEAGYSESDILAAYETEWIASLRAKRNQLLADCDWTQAFDSPLTKIERYYWREYRQKLRDLPNTETNLFQPTWPENQAK